MSAHAGVPGRGRLVLTGVAFALGLVTGCTAMAARGGHAQSVEVQDAIWSASQEHGVAYPWLLRVARCESGYHPWVVNRASGAAGLFQFMPGTWRWMSAAAGWAGASPYDPWAAASVAGWAFAHGYAAHWTCK